jgi:hypothetical protein
MRHSAMVLALCLSTVFATPAALAGNLMSFKFVMQQNCISSPFGFTSDFDIIGPGGPIPIEVSGNITFDTSNGLAFEHDHAIVQFAVFPQNPPPTPSGIFPVLLFESQCIFDFEFSKDLSFTIAQKGRSCTSRALNGPNTGLVSTNTGAKLAGQFAPDLQSFIAGNFEITVVETIFPPNAPQFNRICETTMQGVRVGSDKK